MKKLICFLAVLVLFSPAGFAGEVAAADTCWAAGDINGDGIVLTVSDLVLAIKILTCEAPVPDSLYQIDLTADCRVDSADLKLYQDIFIYGPGILPRPFPVPTCCNPSLTLIHAAAKGDINADGGVTPADAALLLTCTFTETGNVYNGTATCSLCQADLNCDFELTPADIVQELNYVFSATSPSGCP